MSDITIAELRAAYNEYEKKNQESLEEWGRSVLESIHERLVEGERIINYELNTLDEHPPSDKDFILNFFESRGVKVNNQPHACFLYGWTKEEEDNALESPIDTEEETS